MIRTITLLSTLALLTLPHTAAAAPDDAHWADAVSTYYTTDDNAPWHPTRIQQDSRGLIWIGSWNGLYRFDGYDFQSFKPEPGQGTAIDNDRIREILMMDGDTLLCRYDERVYAFDVIRCQFADIPDERQEALDRYMTSQDNAFVPAVTLTYGGRSFDNIQQEYVDRQGNHWLKGADRIYCIHADQRHGATVDDQLSLIQPRCLYRDSEGCYWVCSRDDRQVVLYDPDWHRIGYLGTDGRIHTQPTHFSPIYCIFDDGQGTLWLGSKPDGLYRLRRQDTGFSVERIPYDPDGQGLPSNAIYDIKMDSVGTLWMATWDCGLIGVDNPHEPQAQALNYIILPERCPSYPADAVKTRRICIRPDGTLLATTTRGLLIIDNIYTSLSQMQMRLHHREANRSESLTSSAVMTMAFDADDHLFVATESGGVCVTDARCLHDEALQFEHITAREGLISDVVLDFASLPDGRLLVLCPNGISLIGNRQDDIESYGPKFWNTSAPFIECTPQIASDSLLLLVHEEGILRVPLRELTQQGVTPYIALTALTLGAEPTRYDIDPCQTLRLSTQQRSMTLRFAALDLRSNRSLRYRTRLTADGQQPGPWSRASDLREVQLQDLRPGEYVLEIRSSNADGQWPDNVRTLTIIVEPRFVEAWYGKLLIILLFAAIIACITWMVMRIRHIDAKRHELLQTYLALLESTTKDKIAAAAWHNNAQHSPTEATDEAADDTTDPAPDPDEADSVTDNEATAPQPVQPHNLSVLEQQFMQRLLKYVEQNISNCNASLADMAEATATSKSSLTRKTHQLLGVTPADFLKEARLKRASQLLLTTSQSLTEIALACGFSDPKYFSKCFKASTGKTPTEFRS